MELLDAVLVRSHAIAGAIALVVGLGPLVMPKGSPLHRRIGRLYAAAMAWLSVSSLVILILFRPNLFMLGITLLAGYLAWTGFRFARHRGPVTSVDRATATAAVAAGAAFAAFGLVQVIVERERAFGLLAIAFGAVLAAAGRGDRAQARGRPARAGSSAGKARVLRHAESMLASYLVAFTAFFVQNGDRWLPVPRFDPLLWILPSIVALPLIALLLRRYGGRPGVGSSARPVAISGPTGSRGVRTRW